ncbi:hypothetical protein BIFGAL_03607 [Bifidobacterium gallicum DSM 20093 = LMG 11596]|uniref:Uncharacterized protein n=1 Tax=Bifidobacterium gallicum DSM 20093 = LMG 11596 TaxID=561180 RepID=D1NUT0_9BIFI|nr:hypothetical protein BIFGAL_03607 [Bifidobacterium gallicum DSM 20093 = LMG 11596]
MPHTAITVGSYRIFGLLRVITFIVSVTFSQSPKEFHCTIPIS